MKYLPWWVLLSCSITMLVVGINLDTMAFSCLAFELSVALFFAWKIRAAYKAADKEQADESNRPAAAGTDDRGPGGIGRDSDLRPVDQA